MTERPDVALECPHELHAAVSLQQCGISLLTTCSGTRLLLAMVLAPDTGQPFTTATRYAAEGLGTHRNGEPMTTLAARPLVVGERSDVDVLVLNRREQEAGEVLPSLPGARYGATEILTTTELNYDFVTHMSSHVGTASS